ncbi:hypothetical protein ACQ4PT_043657 [Festuca glaucescens]
MACRRSPRLHPQVHASEDGAGMARRRSPRLHPQIRTSEDGAVMACRRSPRLHTPIHASQYGAGITRRRRRGTSLPDNEDMLWEILLRLPPQPWSLPRASAVCKRWRGLVTDPRFIRRFHAHHRKPPLLGVFESLDEIMLGRRAMLVRHFLNRRIKLRSILELPDRIPLLAIEASFHPRTELLGCRHGRVLLLSGAQEKVSVCNPITGELHRVCTPPDFTRYDYLNVAVLCAAADQGHVHGSCHSSPFKVVVMSPYGEDDRPVACVYTSETGVWGSIISTTARCKLGPTNPEVLVGNVMYWSSKSGSTGASSLDLEPTDDIIEFDLDRQNLGVIKGPPDLNSSLVHQIVQTEDGAVGLVVFSHGIFKMWERKVNCHGGATWLLQKTLEMHTILGLPAQIEGPVAIMGYDEDNGVIFLYADAIVYMVQHISMQSRKLYESRCATRCYPYTSFYASGDCSSLVLISW